MSTPEALLDQCATQLAGHRLDALAHDRVDRLRQRQTGLEAAGHQAERLGELAVEGAEPTPVAPLEVDPREHGAEQQAEDAEEAAAQEEER